MSDAASPVALVTGGTRGIGLGIARSLAAEGYSLAVNGVREESVVADVLNSLRSDESTEVLYCRGDVSQAKDRERMVEEIRSRFGRLNVLINNAGITSPGRDDILNAHEANFDRVLGVNLKGPFFLTQLVANWMIEQREQFPDARRCVINVSSVSAEFVSTNRGDYCLTKAATGMATKLWAVRLAEFRHRCLRGAARRDPQ